MSNRQPTPPGPPSRPIGKPLKVTPAEPENKPRKKREKSIVRIYKKIPGARTLQPVEGTSGAEPMTFVSTQEAMTWARKNLTENGQSYQVVTIQREFTVKAEPQIKVTLE